ncbi:type IV pilus modification protein PilV [Thiohalobacter sp.]|uniref:type IV pilus modification protein PilV n=1 Tax=Thiohalobacter sp. TaxID=2025948 RepID=UPI00260BE652|nr:type IV pilus modification protein PilV [Thiohalobacter sp.]
MPNDLRTHSPQQCGFTLIEVMIAVLVLSIGLLGLAGLQVTALRNNQTAFLRSQAAILSSDIIERMRANQAGVAAGAYDKAAGAARAACKTTAGCSAADMAANDVYEWRQLVRQYLPTPNSTTLGEAIVCIDSTPGDGTGVGNHQCDGALTNGVAIYAVKIWWDNDRSGTLSGSLVTTFQP